MTLGFAEMLLKPLLFGPFSSHPQAPAFASEVLRVHRRYAAEIVAAHRLCPFLHDVDASFGRFCVILSNRLDLDLAHHAFVAAESAVVHLVFPLLGGGPGVDPTPAQDFERFGADVGRAARDWWRGLPSADARFGPEPPVVATFHPHLAGDRSSPHRLIGVLRRAPDPFVQVIPGGHHESGTTVASHVDFENTPVAELIAMFQNVAPAKMERAEETYARIEGDVLRGLVDRLAEIRADRDASYAPWLRAFDVGAPSP